GLHNRFHEKNRDIIFSVIPKVRSLKINISIPLRPCHYL
ncbi:MAG: hypothetical protein ACI8YQ_005238, partial [Polaribacter sp.]